MANEKNVFKDIVNVLNRLDGKQLGKGIVSNKTKLSKDGKGAWTERMAEQYRNKEYINGEPVDMPPEDMEITNAEIVRELFEDDWNTMFGH